MWETIFGGWICLSDPENDAIPAFFPAPDPTGWSPPGQTELPVTGMTVSTIIVVIIVALSVLIVVTGVLLVVLRKSNKSIKG